MLDVSPELDEYGAYSDNVEYVKEVLSVLADFHSRWIQQDIANSKDSKWMYRQDDRIDVHEANS